MAGSSRSTVIKLKFGDRMSRFNAFIHNNKFGFNMVMLKEKISNRFGDLHPEFTLTYIDEDQDVITLSNDDDLHDIASQALNPVRITVKTNHAKSSTPSLDDSFISGAYTILKRVAAPLRAELLNILLDLTRETMPPLSFTKLEYLKALVLKDTSHVNFQEDAVKSFVSGVYAIMKCVPMRMHAHLFNDLLDLTWKTMAPSETLFDANLVKLKAFALKNAKDSNMASNVNPYLENDHFQNYGGYYVSSYPHYMMYNGINRYPNYIASYSSYVPWFNRGYVIHEGVVCRWCGANPITGPRFKSKLHHDYDLCWSCLERLGQYAGDYIRMDVPDHDTNSKHPEKVDPKTDQDSQVNYDNNFSGVVEAEDMFFDAQTNTSSVFS